MCGRFTLTAKPQALADAFGLDAPPEGLEPHFNIAPSQAVAAIPNTEPRHLARLRWGLVPSWAKDPAIGHRMINARAESVADKPSFRAAFRKRRCLVVADGFYEWKRDGKRKTPMYIRMKSGDPFAFAGLWEVWKPPGATTAEPLRTCTILTTTPNDLVAPIHDRMPVILPRAAWDLWLTPDDPGRDALESALRPFPGDEMEAFSVSTLVNSPANDRPECIEPA